MTQHIYHFLGLRITSDFPISELDDREQFPASGGNPDIKPPEVSFQLGALKNHIDDPIKTGPAFQAKEKLLLLNIPGLMKIKIADGHSIIFDPDQGCDLKDMKAFLFGPALATLLQQRGHLILHASAVLVGDKAALFCGPSAIGKSTIVSNLDQQGYPLLSDELCIIDPKTMELMGYLPRCLLWRDRVEALGLNPDDYERERDALDKYAVPMGQESTGTPIGNIYLLARDPNKANIWIEEQAGLTGTITLSDNIYRIERLKAMGLAESTFLMATQLANRSSIFTAYSPMGKAHLPALLSRIEQHLLENRK